MGKADLARRMEDDFSMSSDSARSESIHLYNKHSSNKKSRKSPTSSVASISKTFGRKKPRREKSPSSSRKGKKYLKYKADDNDSLDDQVPRFLAKYMYIPSWTLVAHHRFPTFFWECVAHYFDYQDWPEWDALPDKFIKICERFKVTPTSIHQYAGWAPIWLYVLRKLDERWFKAVVENFFENHALPTWNELPSSFVRKFEDLRIHEKQYLE